MTVPFSAARTGLPSGASILMPVPLDAMKSVVTLPDTGQRNLSAPDIDGLGCIALTGDGSTLATCTGACTAGVSGFAAAVLTAGTGSTSRVLPPEACGVPAVIGASIGLGARLCSGAPSVTPAVFVAVTGATLVRPGMISFMPT